MCSHMLPCAAGVVQGQQRRVQVRALLRLHRQQPPQHPHGVGPTGYQLLLPLLLLLLLLLLFLLLLLLGGC
jgi:hypothetical protein